MSCQLFKTQFWLPLIFICGCSPSDSGPSPPSTVTTSGKTATVSKSEETGIRGATVDPAVDAGMMADEMETKARLTPKPLVIDESPAEAVVD